MDHYSVLGSEKEDNIGSIKRRYQELIVKHHPDKNNGEESTDFIRIRTAWETLSDVESRRVYDAELSNQLLNQDTTVWCTVNINLLSVTGDVYTYSCKCTGIYEIDEEELKEIKAEGETDFLLGCDSCSLNILVQF